jgi:hypothetical protein
VHDARRQHALRLSRLWQYATPTPHQGRSPACAVSRLRSPLLLAANAPSVASADTSRFGKFFQRLPGLTTQTNQELADLAQTQPDPNADSANNCVVNAPPSGCLESGFTHVGQFLIVSPESRTRLRAD